MATTGYRIHADSNDDSNMDHTQNENLWYAHNKWWAVVRNDDAGTDGASLVSKRISALCHTLFKLKPRLSRAEHVDKLILYICIEPA